MTDRAETLRMAREDPGYAKENVVPITALERESIEALWAELRTRLPDHEHGPYGWRGCTSCRQREAERVSALFPARPE